MTKSEAEAEANYFAEQLLVPTKFLREDIAKLGGVDFLSDDKLKKLARKYRVSLMLMSKRIDAVTKEIIRNA